MSAEIPLDAPFHSDSSADEVSAEAEGSVDQGPRGVDVVELSMTPAPSNEVTPVPIHDDSNPAQVSVPSPPVVIGADGGADAFVGASPADVLMTGPEGGLERIGSVAPAASEQEIEEVLESLQFEEGRVLMPPQFESVSQGGPMNGSEADSQIVEETGREANDAAAPVRDEEPTGREEEDARQAPSDASASDASEAQGAGAKGDDEDEEAALEAELRDSVHRRRPLVAPALIALDRLDEDATFKVRDEGDVSRLATDLARVGQLFPIDVRAMGADRFQVVSGFRRLAALRFLHREFVLARVHAELSDEDAQLMALAAAIHAEPVAREQLEQVREDLEAAGRMFPAVRDMLEKALQDDDNLAPESPETGEDEVDADELASDVSQRLGAINQELSMLADVFGSLEASRRAELLMQLRYSSDLVAYLEGQS